MTHEVSCAWTGGMSFEADVLGAKVVMDADEASGGRGEGSTPKPLILAALAGCTGMDVASLLKKMREPVTWFNLKVEAEIAAEHPKRYTSFKIVYQFKAADGLNRENVHKAVSLSQEKYCGVNALLKAAAPVAWDIEYL